MPSRRRTFTCGHKGRGEYCHRCRSEEERFAQRLEKKSREKELYHTLQRECEESLEGIPLHIVRKATQIWRSLQQKTPLVEFDAQRMEFDRRCISVRLSEDYRLLLREEKEGALRLVGVVSHEEYNARIRNAALKGW